MRRLVYMYIIPNAFNKLIQTIYRLHTVSKLWSSRIIDFFALVHSLCNLLLHYMQKIAFFRFLKTWNNLGHLS